MFGGPKRGLASPFSQQRHPRRDRHRLEGVVDPRSGADPPTLKVGCPQCTAFEVGGASPRISRSSASALIIRPYASRILRCSSSEEGVEAAARFGFRFGFCDAVSCTRGLAGGSRRSTTGCCCRRSWRRGRRPSRLAAGGASRGRASAPDANLKAPCSNAPSVANSIWVARARVHVCAFQR
jgi:hypothetical protein